jgi:hypothetical protein
MTTKSLLAVLLLFAVIVSISGCTSKTATNGTFGEQTISLSNMSIVNNVTNGSYQYNGTNYHYIDGFVKNNNVYDAYDLKMKATIYDVNNTVLAVNDTPYYYSNGPVPAGGEMEFYFEFNDPNNQTDHYSLQLISVSAQAS